MRSQVNAPVSQDLEWKKIQEMEIFCFFLAYTEVIFSIEEGLFKIIKSFKQIDADMCWQ